MLRVVEDYASELGKWPRTRATAGGHRFIILHYKIDIIVRFDECAVGNIPTVLLTGLGNRWLNLNDPLHTFVASATFTSYLTHTY